MTEQVTNTRTGAGALIGGLVGFICAGPIGAGVGALVGGGVAHASSQPDKGVMTPRRKIFYEKAMASTKDPEDLKKLAAAFAGEGLNTEAEMLRKRAALRALPRDEREKRRQFFRHALTSDNADAIQQAADIFHGDGAFGAAKALYEHAEAVRAAHAAGVSTKPMTGGTQEQFANKLADAITHFGPNSSQARMAAGNLARARGKNPTKQLIDTIIRISAGSLVQEPPQGQVVEQPVPQDAEQPVVTEQAVAQDAQQSVTDVQDVQPPVAVAGDNPPEPTVIGPPAPKVEPVVAGEADGQGAIV